MKYLLDANVLLEHALLRADHHDVDELIRLVPGRQLVVSQFSLHAIAYYMTPRNLNGFRSLVMDLSMANVCVIGPSVDELIRVTETMERLKGTPQARF